MEARQAAAFLRARDCGGLTFITGAVLCPAKKAGEEQLTPLSWLGRSQRAAVLTVLWLEDKTSPWGWGGGPVPRQQINSDKSPRLEKTKQNPGACLALPACQHPAVQSLAGCLGVPSYVVTS